MYLEIYLTYSSSNFLDIQIELNNEPGKFERHSGFSVLLEV